MKIIIDKYIPYLAEVLAEVGEVVALEPEAITQEIVRDADALIVRTRTRCDAALLAGSKVQFIATATIGFDHIDARYCEEHGIQWMSCPGCNAQGVCDYVETALDVLFPNESIENTDCNAKGNNTETACDAVSTNKTIAVVGCGHVGSKVVKMAERKGYHVLCYDPPLAAHGVLPHAVQRLEEITQADIITFHTPLTRNGQYPTYHIADEAFFAHLKKDVLLINAARGGVIDEQAWVRFLQQNPQARAVVDCWEGEPHISDALLQRASLATYHIAGYTVAGKYRASEMCLKGLIAHFSLPAEMSQSLRDALQARYMPSNAPQVGFDISHTSQQLKASPAAFEALRKAYILR